MRLISLKYTNFKGLRSYLFEPNGQNADVMGDNGTFKTTLYDGFLWLLFGKDSQGKTDFSIKTLDANNKVIPGLDHEVEGVLDIGGRKLTLKKVYREIWKQKRGSASKMFSGHEVNHFVDGVPVSKKDYDARIAAIASEDIFKMLTSPLYFNEQLHWTERRNILLEVCGDISDADVIASDKALAKLPDILQGRKPDDHRKVITSRRAEINKELQSLPIRIDEAERALPDISSITPATLATDIGTLKAVKQKKQEEQARIISGGEVAEKKRQLAEVEHELLKLRNEHRAGASEIIIRKQTKLNEVKVRVMLLENEIGAIKKRMELINTEAKNLGERIKLKRDVWFEINDQQFEIFLAPVCPTCGRDLPEEQLAEARGKAEADFNREKAERLEQISAEGKSLKIELESIMTEHSTLVAKINDAEQKLHEEEAEAERIQAEIDTLAGQDQSITDNPVYIQKLKEREQLETAIQQLNTGNQEALEKVRHEIADIDIALEALEDSARKVRAHKDGQRRIEELKEQEKKLAAEFEKLEGELYLAYQFTKTKVALLDEKINSCFEFARFKMFKENINGGIEPCCETLCGGVPYSGGLNAGHKIIAGMDIIRTLSKRYGFTAPIFVDNAESVTTLPKMNAQVIRLIKPEITDENRQKYSKLVIKIESKKDYREAV